MMASFVLGAGLLALACGGGEPAAATTCTSNAQCPTGQYCGTGSVCTFDCTRDKDCPGGSCSSLGRCVGGAAGLDAGTPPPAELGSAGPALDGAPPLDAKLAAEAKPAPDASGACQSASQWTCSDSFWQGCNSTCGSFVLECYGNACYCSSGLTSYKECPASAPPAPPGGPGTKPCGECEAAIACCQGL